MLGVPCSWFRVGGAHALTHDDAVEVHDSDGSAETIHDAVKSAAPIPLRLAAVAIVALLLAGLAGFLIDRHIQHGDRATARSTATSVSTTATSDPTNSSDASDGPAALTVTANTCSAQVGDELQLGAEFSNHAASRLVLLQAGPAEPLLGLRVTADSQIGTCGQLHRSDVAGQTLDPGHSIWITTTVLPSAGCPWGLTFPFDVTYSDAGQTFHVHLNPFPDLIGYPYSGCTRPPSASGYPGT